jgi:hypothetical protein
MYDSANAGGRKKRWAAAVGVLAAGAIGGGVLASALTASASGDTSTASPKLRQVRRAIPGLTWCFAGLAGWCSGYVKVSGMAAPMRLKAWRWALVGSVSIGTVTWVPVNRTWLRVRVARWSIRLRKLR